MYYSNSYFHFQDYYKIIGKNLAKVKGGEEFEEARNSFTFTMLRFLLIVVTLPLVAASSLRRETPDHAAAVKQAKATVVTTDHISTMNVR